MHFSGVQILGVYFSSVQKDELSKEEQFNGYAPEQLDRRLAGHWCTWISGY